MPVKVAADFQAPASGSAEIHLSASWLICRVECIPESGEFTLQLPVQGSTATHGDDFLKAHTLQPVQLGTAGKATVQAAASDDRINVRISDLPAALQGQPLELYPENADTFKHAAESSKDWQQRWDGSTWVAEGLPLSDMRGAAAGRGRGLPAAAHTAARPAHCLAQRTRCGWPMDSRRADRRFSGPGSGAGSQQECRGSAHCPSSASASSLWAALLGGLIGGLILNLMPCVFPVLAIKVLGFAGHGQNQRAQRMGGLAYAAGVILSFLALGALLLSLRAAGQQLAGAFSCNHLRWLPYSPPCSPCWA